MDNDFGFGRRGNGSSASATGLVNGTASGPGLLSPLGVEAIVLDIDDTLYLERDYVRSGFEAVGRWAQRELGVADFADRAWAAFEGGARHTIFDEVLTACGARTDDATITELVARYRTHPPSIVLAADAEAGLDRWHGVAALAAITDGPLSSQQAKARALGLERWTSTVVFTASLGPGKGKPDPAAFELVQEELGVGGKSCVYVADNPAKDFVGPKALGWRTVRVRRRLSLHAEVESGTDVDHEITTLEQLDAVLAP
jgi:putative hydrolase of the HAD superfamily